MINFVLNGILDMLLLLNAYILYGIVRKKDKIIQQYEEMLKERKTDEK